MTLLLKMDQILIMNINKEVQVFQKYYSKLKYHLKSYQSPLVIHIIISKILLQEIVNVKFIEKEKKNYPKNSQKRKWKKLMLKNSLKKY